MNGQQAARRLAQIEAEKRSEMETSLASSQRHIDELGARLEQERRGAAARQQEAEALRAQLDALRREAAELRAQLLQREGQVS